MSTNTQPPNPKYHQSISFIKSIVRIGGYMLVLINLEAAVAVLVISEFIGIVEELV